MDTAAIFDAMYAAMTEARARIRIDGQAVIENALCSGIGKMREPTEAGMMHAISDTVRVKAADVPPGKCEIGNTIEVSVNGGAWIKAKITQSNPTGAVLAFTLGAQYG